MMIRLVRLFAVLALLAGPVGAATGCHRQASIVTSAGHAAFTANEILTRVERLQDAVIAAHASGALSTDTARAIVFVTVNLAEVADAATQGWQATARQAWTQAKAERAELRPGGRFAVFAAAIDEALGGGL